jgi:co-chaperonin GroES (HSP10)
MSSEMEKAAELVERQVYGATSTAATMVIDDGSNEATIPGFPYAFEALWDNVLVSVDIFKSGYECKLCKGVGRIKSHCVCEDKSNPGYKYSTEQLLEFTNTLGKATSIARGEIKCSTCQGDYQLHRIDAVCPDCNGKQSLIHIPDQGKMLPTTGVIVSLGKDVNKESFKCGMRVLFGAYTGVMIPTKAPGIVFKVMRSHEILCEIKGGEDMAAFDFVIPDKDL